MLCGATYMRTGAKHYVLSVIAGIGLLVVFSYWFIILVPARPIDRIIDQYGLFIFLAILVAATVASVIATIRVSRWWAVASLAGIAAVVKFSFTIASAWRG